MDQSTQPLVCPSHKMQYFGAVILGIIIGAAISFAYFTQTRPATGVLVGLNPQLQALVEVRSISGVVTAINGNRITINANPMPFDDVSTSTERTVNVASNTQIVKVTQGDMKAFQVQMDAFMKKVQSGKTVGVTPPTPPETTRTTVDISNIKIGDTIGVTTTENIRAVKDFSASEIDVY